MRHKYYHIAKKIMNELKDYEPYIKAISQYGSIYIKFKYELLRSIRIGDHDGREKYRYKWNLRMDILNSYNEIDRNVERFYYCSEDMDNMINNIKKIYKKIYGELNFNDL